MALVHVPSGKACFLMRDSDGQVVCSFFVDPDHDVLLLGSALTSRSSSVQGVVDSGGTYRLEQLGVSFADTGVLLAYENAYHEATVNSTLGVLGDT